MTNWISIKSRKDLPDVEEDVLVRCRSREQYVSHRVRDDYNGRLNWRVSGPLGAGRRLLKTVTHWMPLPEDPEGTEHE